MHFTCCGAGPRSEPCLAVSPHAKPPGMLDSSLNNSLKDLALSLLSLEPCSSHELSYFSHAFCTSCLLDYCDCVLSSQYLARLSLLLPSISSPPLITDLWIVPQLRFCLIPTCNYLFPNFWLVTDPCFCLIPTCYICYWTPACSLPGGGDHEECGLVLTCSKSHLHHEELWWIPISAWSLHFGWVQVIHQCDLLLNLHY